ncbi:MFS transporter [Paraburkholderia strydomiana]
MNEFKFYTLLVSRLLTTAANQGTTPFLVLLLTSVFHFTAPTAVTAVGGMLLLGRFLSVPTGKLIDKFGARKIVLLSLLASLVSYVLLSNATKHPGSYVLLILFLAFRTVGLASQLIGFRVIVAKYTSDEKISSRASWAGSAVSVGTVLGAAVAGPMVAAQNYFLLCFVAATCELISIASMVVATRDLDFSTGSALRTIAQRENAVQTKLSDPESLRDFLYVTAVTACLLQIILLTLATYLKVVHHHAEFASAFYGIQAAALMLFLPVAGRAFKKSSVAESYTFYSLGTVVLFAGVAAAGLAYTANGLVVVAILGFAAVVSQLLATPTADSFIVRSVGRQNMGQVYGRVSNAFAIGNLVGVGISAAILSMIADARWLPTAYLTIGVTGIFATGFLAHKGKKRLVGQNATS